MSSVNKVILVGYLGADPELRRTTSGVPVCNLKVATTLGWTDKDGGKHESTEWHRVVVWKEQAEACAKYLAKGRQAYVEGRIGTRTWTDKDGNKKFATEVLADRVVFLGKSGDERGRADVGTAPEETAF